MGLSGKLALVTGGGRGIGRAVCQILSRENAQVIVTDLNLDNCNQTLQSLSQLSHLAVQSDVSSSNSVKLCFEQILDKYKRAPDIIVNSAGITKDGFLLRMKEQDFDQVIDVNLKGTFLVTQTGAGLMKDQGIQGSIVNIASIVGKTGNIGQANYTASKAGVIGFTKTAAKELGKFGIRVNAVLPGFIQTAMTDAVPDKVKEKIVAEIPLGHLGQPEDIAYTCLFLASSRSKYITGASIEVAGGLGV
ncbi:estradiol 17-beta-dehydrogenase 8 [Eurytemora carolleeae]|uniref:estradiol 17-beta-dehydrogenase 8 n=1 Tax=Eurytemora carolleeae TaxID=1294199 RepID=UPI000C764B99|nr:estradiol 17-beta-dehydrogenase 8 [Eurytemora carolleeae]|eukprot:XP_023341629.1 estradiol 17-beta-dehydrogenase 8-like [Eurytemora affinis]